LWRTCCLVVDDSKPQVVQAATRAAVGLLQRWPWVGHLLARHGVLDGDNYILYKQVGG
jgi:hypothetical protein